MNNFSEVQKFRQWWLWVILVGTLVVPTGMILWANHEHPTDKLASAILIGAIVPVLIMVLFIFMQLRTRIDEKGIYYRFFPIHFQVLVISWDEVTRAYVRKYNPILDYGGWGIRWGLGGKGKAYNTSGNLGLQLELNTGKKILIGTQQPNEMNEILDQLVRAKIITAAVRKP